MAHCSALFCGHKTIGLVRVLITEQQRMEDSLWKVGQTCLPEDNLVIPPTTCLWLSLESSPQDFSYALETTMSSPRTPTTQSTSECMSAPIFLLHIFLIFQTSLHISTIMSIPMTFPLNSFSLREVFLYQPLLEAARPKRIARRSRLWKENFLRDLIIQWLLKTCVHSHWDEREAMVWEVTCWSALPHNYHHPIQLPDTHPLHLRAYFLLGFLQGLSASDIETRDI